MLSLWIASECERWKDLDSVVCKTGGGRTWSHALHHSLLLAWWCEGCIHSPQENLRGGTVGVLHATITSQTLQHSTLSHVLLRPRHCCMWLIHELRHLEESESNAGAAAAGTKETKTPNIPRKHAEGIFSRLHAWIFQCLASLTRNKQIFRSGNTRRWWICWCGGIQASQKNHTDSAWPCNIQHMSSSIHPSRYPSIHPSFSQATLFSPWGESAHQFLHNSLRNLEKKRANRTAPNLTFWWKRCQWHSNVVTHGSS